MMQTTYQNAKLGTLFDFHLRENDLQIINSKRHPPSPFVIAVNDSNGMDA
jgi:hypothetical protein